MRRTEVITESRSARIDLTGEQAAALRELGRSLASNAVRPGSRDEDISDRTVIRCTATEEEGVYALRVSDAIGVIGVLDDLQIEVRPKIPLDHLVYILQAAGELPRMDDQQAEVASGDNLLELMARWFLTAAERLLRRGLIKDYSSRQDFLRAKRGRLKTVPTARAFYSGRVGLRCEFDEFDVDTPLNRVVRAGADVVARNPSLSTEIRREALRIRVRMDYVSSLEPFDLRAKADRRAGHYLPALPLAKQLIRAESRSLRSGSRATWSFLVRTPEMVEEGIRNILAQGLGARWGVTTGRVCAEGANLSFNPDLEFGGGIAVGDVKYKLQGAEWNRADLNQIVTFVAAYDCAWGAVFSFREQGLAPVPSLGVGRQRIQSITWPVGGGLEPSEAATHLVSAARAWLEGSGRSLRVV